MAEASERFGSLTLGLKDDGVGVVVFDRPPVNAVSISVYEDIGRLANRVQDGTDVRVLVPHRTQRRARLVRGCRPERLCRHESRAPQGALPFINASLPRFAALDRPVIAAITGAAIGIGMVLAGLCDLRVAAEDARFACPEIDYGLVCGGAGLFAMLNMPEAKVREMLFTGGRFTAREL